MSARSIGNAPNPRVLGRREIGIPSQHAHRETDRDDCALYLSCLNAAAKRTVRRAGTGYLCAASVCSAQCPRYQKASA